ncbi:hypothetical protein MPH_01006 [Macrophomina phaseolina MS6]|uniref:Uncharacterized protein n=1 Tax=Macrophomina phaseolina (strain MS6) TaxID=1126212 RepID=K2RGM9_MACPH|nr:hypothetical protein MPH_01006 [Macrophomina phaseolina MS6]
MVRPATLQSLAAATMLPFLTAPVNARRYAQIVEREVVSDGLTILVDETITIKPFSLAPTGDANNAVSQGESTVFGLTTAFTVSLPSFTLPETTKTVTASPDISTTTTTTTTLLSSATTNAVSVLSSALNSLSAIAPVITPAPVFRSGNHHAIDCCIRTQHLQHHHHDTPSRYDQRSLCPLRSQPNLQLHSFFLLVFQGPFQPKSGHNDYSSRHNRHNNRYRRHPNYLPIPLLHGYLLQHRISSVAINQHNVHHLQHHKHPDLPANLHDHPLLHDRIYFHPLLYDRLHLHHPHDRHKCRPRSNFQRH